MALAALQAEHLILEGVKKMEATAISHIAIAHIGFFQGLT
jgi:hypothetical protein